MLCLSQCIFDLLPWVMLLLRLKSCLILLSRQMNLWSEYLGSNILERAANTMWKRMTNMEGGAGTVTEALTRMFPPQIRDHHGGAVSSVPVRDSPPPLRALRAHLVTKGQWLVTIHMVAPKAPEKFLSFPLPT